MIDRFPAMTLLPTALSTPLLSAQDDCLTKSVESPIPAPTGRFKVGRTSYYVSTTAKTDVGSPTAELMVYVWYPAAEKASGILAPYIPGWPLATEAALDSLQRAVSESSTWFAACGIPTHAIEKRSSCATWLSFASSRGVTSTSSHAVSRQHR